MRGGLMINNIIYLWFPPKNYEIGGMYAHVKGIINGFIENGYNVILITSSINIPITHPNLKVEFIKNKSKLPYPLNMKEYSKTITPTVISKIKEINPEFIYHRYELFIDIFQKIRKKTSSKLLLEYNGSYVWMIKHWTGNPLKKVAGLLLLPMIKSFEKEQLVSADKIIVVSAAQKEEIIKDYNIDEKILSVTNGYDPRIFFPTLKNKELIDKYNLKDKRIIGFSGTFGPWHGTEILAKSIKPVIDIRKDISFLFIGEGALKKDCEKIVQEDGVFNNCVFVGKVPFAQMNAYLNLCDILVNPTIENKDGSEFFGSPTKLFEYIGTEKTIITSNIGQMKELFSEDEVYFTNPGDVNDLSNKILLALDKPKKFKNKEKYTWKEIAKDIINSVK